MTNNKDTFDQDFAELYAQVESEHPFTVLVTILGAHLKDQEQIDMDILYGRVVDLAVLAIQSLIKEDELQEMKAEIPSMLEEEPDLTEQDLWISLLAMDPTMMPQVLLVMSNTLSKIIYDVEFDREEKMYEMIEKYIDIYTQSQTDLLNLS